MKTENSKGGPLLSIVVPTRNRHATLNIIVAHILGWKSDDFELIVEDNSDDAAAFAPILAQYGRDARLRYNFSDSPRSATENCDAAVLRARGKVVTFIGDDDILLADNLLVCDWMLDQQIDVQICATGAFTWPDMEHAIAINEKFNGMLVRQDILGTNESVDVQRELSALFALGATRLMRVPRLYHALVQRKVLDALYADLGTYFPGPVPDMANAVAISKYTKRCRYTDIPLIISGQSKNSMSGKNSVRKHQGAISAESSLPNETAKAWDKRNPFFWSGATIWSEAALKAAAASGQQKLIEQFSFVWVYASCFAYNAPSYYPLIWKAMRHDGLAAGISQIPVVAWYVVKIMTQRARTLFGKIFGEIRGDYFVTVAEAAMHLETKIAESGVMDKAFGSEILKAPKRD